MISKEISRIEPEYINMDPPSISALDPPLFGNKGKQRQVKFNMAELQGNLRESWRFHSQSITHSIAIFPMVIFDDTRLTAGPGLFDDLLQNFQVWKKGFE